LCAVAFAVKQTDFLHWTCEFNNKHAEELIIAMATEDLNTSALIVLRGSVLIWQAD
jgi:hypothetical protein